MFNPYEKFEAAKPEPRILHQTLSATRDREDSVTFEVKPAGKESHMSSTIYLERKFTVVPELPSQIPEFSVLEHGEDHTRQYRPFDMSIDDHEGLAFLRAPGFVLQNNASQLIFNCNAGSVGCDPRFLESYSKLYAKDLSSFVRGSGGSFSNHNDTVVRRGNLNTDFMDGPNFVNGYRYCNHERNDRRIRGDSFQSEIDMRNNGYAYYHETPFDNTVPALMDVEFGTPLVGAEIFPTVDEYKVTDED